MDVAEDVYRLSARFPPDERFGMTSQIRRSCLSIAANIAEGAGRGSDRDFRRFLHIAVGSLEEVLTYLEFAKRMAWLEGPEADPIARRLITLRRRIVALIRKLRN